MPEEWLGDEAQVRMDSGGLTNGAAHCVGPGASVDH